MSNDLQKIEIEQRLRLALLRNRGVIRDTIDDYERTYGVRLPEDYVIKVYKRFRREVKQDNLRWVSYHFAQEFISQAAKVQHQLDMQIQDYNKRSIQVVSVCCHAPVRVHPVDPDKFLCLKCDTQCDVKEEMDKEMERLKLKVIDKLQKEQDLTMRFLEGMGFLQKRSGSGQVSGVGSHADSETLSVRDVTRSPKLPDGLDPDLQEDLNSLDPRDAQLMLDGGLELTVEFEDEKNEDSGTETSK